MEFTTTKFFLFKSKLQYAYTFWLVFERSSKVKGAMKLKKCLGIHFVINLQTIYVHKKEVLIKKDT